MVKVDANCGEVIRVPLDLPQMKGDLDWRRWGILPLSPEEMATREFRLFKYYGNVGDRAEFREVWGGFSAEYREVPNSDSKAESVGAGDSEKESPLGKGE